MTFPPGWDSPEFVRDAHSILEFSSIIGFLACAGCEWAKHVWPSKTTFEKWAVGLFIGAVLLELIGFPYSKRDDTLADNRARLQDEELRQIKTPRSLLHTDELIFALKQFKDSEYTFSCVASESEAIDLLKQMDSLLHNAAWKRVPPPAGFPAINVYGKDQEFAVPVCLNDGILVSVDSDRPLPALQALTIGAWPMHVRAAVDFNLNLRENISPRNQKNVGEKVDVQQGTSATVRIAVGKKPE